MTEQKSERPAWLVLAMICDCDLVALTIMNRAHVADTDEAWSPGIDGAHPGSEVVMSGPDWRPLIVEAAKEMRDRSGRPISTLCTTASVGDAVQCRALEEEASEILYSTFYPETWAKLKPRVDELKRQEAERLAAKEKRQRRQGEAQIAGGEVG